MNQTIFLIIIGLAFIPVAYAEEQKIFVTEDEFYFTYFDGNEYPVNYELVNSELIEYRIPDMSSSMIFYVNGTDGKLILTLPKTIPIDYGYTVNDPLLFVLQDQKEIEPDFTETTCDYILSVSFNGVSEIEFISAYALAGPRIIYQQLDEECLKDEKYNTDIQKKLNDMSCSNDTYEKAFNIRTDVVCIFPESYDELLMRGYLLDYKILMQ